MKLKTDFTVSTVLGDPTAQSTYTKDGIISVAKTGGAKALTKLSSNSIVHQATDSAANNFNALITPAGITSEVTEQGVTKSKLTQTADNIMAAAGDTTTFTVAADNVNFEVGNNSISVTPVSTSLTGGGSTFTLDSAGIDMQGTVTGTSSEFTNLKVINGYLAVYSSPLYLNNDPNSTTTSSIGITSVTGSKAGIEVDNTTPGSEAITLFGAVTCNSGGGVVCPSDKRLKKEVKTDIPGLALITKLRPISYIRDYVSEQQFRPQQEKDLTQLENTERSRQSGLIAQEVEAACDEINYQFDGLHRPRNAQEPYKLNYQSFIMPLIKATQEQQAQIETLEKKLQTLEKLNEKLAETH
ncbi:MAG: hypothetical protein RLZ12_578 [Bacillota bacterium]